MLSSPKYSLRISAEATNSAIFEIALVKIPQLIIKEGVKLTSKAFEIRRTDQKLILIPKATICPLRLIAFFLNLLFTVFLLIELFIFSSC